MIEKVNKRLKLLYEEFMPDLSSLIQNVNKGLSTDNKATNPLLIKADGNYINAKVKIMFFGQETNYWHTEMDGTGQFHGEIEPLLKLYERFYIKENCYSFGGQFWNGVNRFKKLLKSSKNVDFGFIWNNVVKIGKCGKGTPNNEIIDIQQKFFKVIEKEIDILKPDYLVFFSGPNYDYLIKKMIVPVITKPIKGFKERQLCKLESSLEIKTYRTYHPNYLWRNNINKYFKAIINEMELVENE